MARAQGGLCRGSGGRRFRMAVSSRLPTRTTTNVATPNITHHNVSILWAAGPPGFKVEGDPRLQAPRANAINAPEEARATLRTGRERGARSTARCLPASKWTKRSRRVPPEVAARAPRQAVL